MQSSLKISLQRKFLSTETPFISQPQPAPVETRRFPKVLALYAKNICHNENGTLIYEWTIQDVPELRKVAKMYYQRYNIISR